MFQNASGLAVAGELLIVGYFLAAGLMNLTAARIRDHIDRMAELRVPFPAGAFWIGIAVQFAGCVLLLSGWHAEAGAWCLIAFTVAANAIFHRYWTVRDPVRRNTLRLMLLNGIAILGGLLLLLQNVR